MVGSEVYGEALRSAPDIDSCDDLLGLAVDGDDLVRAGDTGVNSVRCRIGGDSAGATASVPDFYGRQDRVSPEL